MPLKSSQIVLKNIKNKKKKTQKKSGMNVTSSVKKYVQGQLHKNIENKTEQTLSTGNMVSAYNQNNSLVVISMIPYGNLSQGLGQGDRIGNEIRSRSTYFNFVLRPAPYSLSYNSIPTPQIVIIMFGKLKSARNYPPGASDFAKLWQAGDSSHAPYSNTLDVLQNVNKDWFTVYKTLTYKLGYAQSNVQGGNSAYQFFQNNDYKFNIIGKINLTKYMPKIVKFNDSSLNPTNDGLFMWVQCVPADGSTAANPIPAYMDYTLNYTYEDA